MAMQKSCKPGTQSVLRYIVAFSYESEILSFEDVCSFLDQNNTWHVSDLRINNIEQDLYDYLLDQFSYRTDRTNIGTAWSYNDLSSLPTISYQMRRNNRDESFNISFSDMGLFLFRSRIGLLWYEIDAPEFDRAADLIKFQRAFKEMNLESNIQRFSILEPDGTKNTFHMGVFIDDIIRQLPCDIRYFAQRKSIIEHKDEHGNTIPIPDKSVLFTYFTEPSATDDVEDHDGDLINWAYYLSTGSNQQHMITDDVESGFFHPFRNVYWNITNEGCACCAKYTKANSDFFTERFTMRFRHDYFSIYVILLHQTYSLLNYSTWIEKQLTADKTEYLTYAEINRSKVEQLLLSINTFLSKNIYASVSHIQHHNDFYSYGVNRMRIKEGVESLALGIDAIGEILEVHENRREASDDSNLNYLFGVLSILVVFSALTDANSLFEIPHDQRITNPLYWLVMASIILLSITVIIRLLRMTWMRRKK